MINSRLRSSLICAFFVSIMAFVPNAFATDLSPAVRAAAGTPPDGKALVVFFRPGKFVGAAIGFKVREGEKELGKLRNSKYFVATVEPGAHVYAVFAMPDGMLAMFVQLVRLLLDAMLK